MAAPGIFATSPVTTVTGSGVNVMVGVKVKVAVGVQVAVGIRVRVGVTVGASSEAEGGSMTLNKQAITMPASSIAAMIFSVCHRAFNNLAALSSSTLR
jgi:hypothetical protein